MRLTKAFGIAGALVLSAILGGTLISATLATDTGDGPTDTTRGAYCDTFLDTLASELGVSRDDLTAAGKTAATATIDAAEAAGDLTAERADALRERVDAADVDGCAGLFKAGWVRGFDHGVGRVFLGGDVVEAAADALGIESSDLIGQLRDAGSLEALADDLGIAYDEVKASIRDSVQADLDAAVEEGLSQDRADAVIEHVTTWLDAGGEAGGLRPHGGPGGPWAPSGNHGDDSAEDAPGA
jgi:hypothetical protein